MVHRDRRKRTGLKHEIFQTKLNRQKRDAAIRLCYAGGYLTLMTNFSIAAAQHQHQFFHDCELDGEKKKDCAEFRVSVSGAVVHVPDGSIRWLNTRCRILAGGGIRLLANRFDDFPLVRTGN